MLIFLLEFMLLYSQIRFLVLIFGGLLGLDIKVKVVILFSNGCHNRLSQTGWLETTEIYCFGVLEAAGPISRHYQGQASSEASKGRSFPHVFQLLGA